MCTWFALGLPWYIGKCLAHYTGDIPDRSADTASYKFIHARCASLNTLYSTTTLLNVDVTTRCWAALTTSMIKEIALEIRDL